MAIAAAAAAVGIGTDRSNSNFAASMGPNYTLALRTSSLNDVPVRFA